MSWTDPRIPWPKGETQTNTILNTYLRDNLKAMYFVVAHQTADLTKNNSTAFSNLAGLTFTVATNEDWCFVAFISYIASAVSDSKYTVTAPASTTGRFGVVGSGIPLTAGSTTTFGGAVARATQGARRELSVMSGRLVAGADGAVQLQAAQNTAEATDTVFHQNSFLVAWRVSHP